MQYFIKLIIVFIPVIGFLFFRLHLKRSIFTILACLYLGAIICVSLLSIGKYVYDNYQQPPTWDFQVFWINGRVSSQGLNFYIPENYHSAAQSLEPDESFTREILDVGFWYPPFSMFLFTPLGWFDISIAFVLWQFINILLAFACIYQLWKMFLQEEGLLGLLLITALFLRLNPTRGTFAASQTNFLALLFFLLFWKNRPKPWSGAWLALCVAVKPYMALLYMYPFFTQKWKMLAVAIGSLLALTTLSIFTFGWNTFVNFFTEGPTSKLPAWVYTEIVNQSLLATILRSTDFVGSPLTHPLYLIIALILTSITIWVTLQQRANKDWKILAILFLALIVYPAALAHYGVFLIIPMAILLRMSNGQLGTQLFALGTITFAYLLSGYNDSGDYSFYANLFMWMVSTASAIKYGTQEIFHRNVDQLPAS